jgi:hypothetical protein
MPAFLVAHFTHRLLRTAVTLVWCGYVRGRISGASQLTVFSPSPITTSPLLIPCTLSPTSSPITRSHHHRRVRSQVGSPRPADILAGKVFSLDSDDQHPPHRSRSTRGSRSLSLRDHRPVMGQFDPVDSNPQKRAVIDHFSKDIPSPFRRARRGTGASVARVRL